MRITLPVPLLPGATTELRFAWAFEVPPDGAPRSGSTGDVFMIAYWYPQVAVYDDVNGWHTDPYMGNAEFYMGYADYDVALSVPAGWLVGATGELVNAEQVLAPYGVEVDVRHARGVRLVPLILMTGFGYDPGHSIVKARQAGLQAVIVTVLEIERAEQAAQAERAAALAAKPSLRPSPEERELKRAERREIRRALRRAERMQQLQRASAASIASCQYASVGSTRTVTGSEKISPLPIACRIRSRPSRSGVPGATKLPASTTATKTRISWNRSIASLPGRDCSLFVDS